MKTKAIPFFLVFSLFFFTACSDDDSNQTDDPPIHFENSTLDVLVEIETDTGLIPAIGAQIYLYDTEQDRTDNMDEEVKGETDALGKHQFSGLSKPEYWITVSLPLEGLVKHINETTPFGTPGHPVVSSQLNVVFEK